MRQLDAVGGDGQITQQSDELKPDLEPGGPQLLQILRRLRRTRRELEHLLLLITGVELPEVENEVEDDGKEPAATGMKPEVDRALPNELGLHQVDEVVIEPIPRETKPAKRLERGVDHVTLMSVERVQNRLKFLQSVRQTPELAGVSRHR